ncbi:AMP-binding protein [Actinomadura scrupuli]|uniref:AMP-binding protein n=1 Tax=Actinomadura scrupuli TaxID=559629 RepID=UPI003D95986A
MLVDRVRRLGQAMAERPQRYAVLGAEVLRGAWNSRLVRPVRPDRAVRLLFPVARFGMTPATAGAMAALRHPGRTAVIDERGSLTFAELEHRAAALATALRTRVGEGRRLGILCRNHRGFVEAALAGSRLGHDVVFLNTDFSARQLSEVLDRENIGALVLDEEFDALLDDASFTGARVTAWHDGPARNPTIDELVAATEPEPLVAGRTARMIILTSGTTGTPKGAQHDLSIGAIVPAMLTHLVRVPLRSGEPIVIGPPLFHVLGLAYLMTGLGLGLPVVLHRKFEAGQALEAVARHRAGALVVVPVMLRRILEVPPSARPATPSLRVVICGGAALHTELSQAFMDAFGDVLHNVYGATETGWATISTPADLRAAPGTVGRPSLGLTLRILKPEGGEAATGETGEIFVGGGLKFAGYTGGGGKEVRDGLTGTGDLGHLDEEGRLFIDGRADDMIVSGGENVFPGEVEDLLEGHEGVAEVAVVGVDDEKFGQRLVAHVVRAGDSGNGQVTEDDLKDHVRRHLARYKVPRDIVFVDELPRTTTGKIKHRALSS